MSHSKNYMLLLREPAVVSSCAKHIRHVMACSMHLCFCFTVFTCSMVRDRDLRLKAMGMLTYCGDLYYSC